MKDTPCEKNNKDILEVDDILHHDHGDHVDHDDLVDEDVEVEVVEDDLVDLVDHDQEEVVVFLLGDEEVLVDHADPVVELVDNNHTYTTSTYDKNNRNILISILSREIYLVNKTHPIDVFFYMSTFKY